MKKENSWKEVRWRIIINMQSYSSIKKVHILLWQNAGSHCYLLFHISEQIAFSTFFLSLSTSFFSILKKWIVRVMKVGGRVDVMCTGTQQVYTIYLRMRAVWWGESDAAGIFFYFVLDFLVGLLLFSLNSFLPEMYSGNHKESVKRFNSDRRERRWGWKEWKSRWGRKESNSGRENI